MNRNQSGIVHFGENFHGKGIFSNQRIVLNLCTKDNKLTFPSCGMQPIAGNFLERNEHVLTLCSTPDIARGISYSLAHFIFIATQ